MARLLFFIFLLKGLHVLGQNPENDASPRTYHPPLSTQLKLSGNFGELRSGHFHTGLDLKTKGRTGIPIKAIEKGYVSRIKIQEGGYGKALYIDHPDGNTSVYGHLKSFAAPIRSFLRKVQYKHERGPIDLYPRKGALSVERGETVARSGNSGRSGAPHLHFEVRNTESEKPINPLLFNFDIRDRRAPEFKGLRVVQAPEGVDFSSGRTFSVRSTGKDRYRPNSRTTIGVTPGEKLGFEVRIVDRASGTYNPLGVHRVEVYVEDRGLFGFKLDTLDFSKKAFVNAHIDHPYLYEKDRNYHRCHLLPHNELPIYQPSMGNGWMMPYRDSLYHLRIDAYDRAGNRSTLRFRIKGGKRYKKEKRIPDLSIQESKLIPWDTSSTFREEGIRLEFPSKALYHTIGFRYKKEASSNDRTLSAEHQVHSAATPLHKPFKAKVALDTFPAGARERLFFLSKDEQGGARVFPASYEEGWAVGEVKRFGTLSVRADSSSPKIQPIRLQDAVPRADKEKFVFRVADNLSGIDRYKATIGGKWCIPVYDAKSRRIIVEVGDPERPLPPGEHKFKLQVSDRAGNTSTLTKKVKVE